MKYEAPHCATFSIVLLLHPSLIQIFSLEPCSQTPSIYSLLLMRETKFHTIQNNWQNCFFLCFNLYIPRQQAGRQKTLDRMVASISRISSALILLSCSSSCMQI
jgi:hypothetical protein